MQRQRSLASARLCSAPSRSLSGATEAAPLFPLEAQRRLELQQSRGRVTQRTRGDPVLRQADRRVLSAHLSRVV